MNRRDIVRYIALSPLVWAMKLCGGRSKRESDPSPEPPNLTPNPNSGPTATHSSTTTATATALGTPPSTPTPGPEHDVLWGAWVPGVPWDMSQQDAFESRVGKRVGIIHFGQGWQWDRVYQPFYPGDYQRIMDRGAVPLLDWGPWDLSARRSVNQPSFALARIIDGDHDTYIRDWATAVMAWGQPLWVRFAWKMNSLWFPWCEGVNDNQPGDYIRAWQHVVDIFRDVGATNVAWVWCPNAVYLGATPLASLFPGETYVDWIGYDAYNWGTTYGAEWTSVAATLDPTYALMRQVSASKPIMLGEIACSENGGSKAAWISDLFAALPRDYPEITALVWFNWNAGNADLDWPIESSVAATAAFAAGINASRYRAGGD